MLLATISISDLELDALVGVFPHERDRLQHLRIHVELQVDVSKALTDERLQHSVDYVTVQQKILFLLGHSRFRLLETASKALATALLTKPEACEQCSPIHRLRLRLTKPGALDGRGLPSLELDVKAIDMTATCAVTNMGKQYDIHRGKDADIYRYVLDRRSVLELNNPRQSVMVLSEGLSSAQGELAINSVLCGDADDPVRVENAAEHAVVLVVNRHYDDVRHQPLRAERLRRPSFFPAF